MRTKGSGTIYKPKNSRYWWVAFTANGKRQFESTKSTRKTDAQELLTSRCGDTQRGVFVSTRVGKLTLGEGLQAVVNDLRMNGRSSVVCERCHVACCGEPGHSNLIQRQIDLHLTAYFKPERLMTTISTSDLTAYVAHRQDEGAASATIDHELATIRRAFKLAVRGKDLVAMPYIPMLALNNARKGFFERAELDAVLAHLPAWLHGVITFAFVTGWRVHSEVLPLTLDRVDLAAGVVRLDVGTSKNREGRSFYLTRELRDVLQAQVNHVETLKGQGVLTPYVFHRDDGSPIKCFKKLWRTATEKAGLPGKLVHDFRRSAVRTMERSGVPRSTAMAMVGHKTESIYKRYAIVDSAMLKEAAAKLEAWSEPAQPVKGRVRRFATR